MDLDTSSTDEVRLFGRFMHDVEKFAGGTVFQPFSAVLKLLVHLDRRFLHPTVRFIGSAVKDEIVAPRQTGVAVLIIESDT